MADWLLINVIPALLLIGAAIGLCLYRLLQTARIMQTELSKPLADRIDALLPQTQCGHCGYPGCKPYARAIADGDAINKCLPGGDPTVRNLAQLLDRPIVALDAPQPPALSYAFIREAECIGCTKCIQACPVDAILGAAKQMHTIIRDECTGCDLCVEPCPVDCIEMRPFVQPVTSSLIATDRGYDATDEERAHKADHYRTRFEAHQIRIANEQQLRERKRQQRLASQQAAAANATAPTTTAALATDDKLAVIAAALARTQARKATQIAAGDASTTHDHQTDTPQQTDGDPQAKRKREIAAIDKRLLTTEEKLQQAIADSATDKIAALQTALQTLREKREAAEQALSQGGEYP